MHRCSLPTPLRLRAPLCRPPWIHSHLPQAARSFAFAARLAKDQRVESGDKKEVKKGNRKRDPEAGPDSDQGAKREREKEKEGKKGSRKKREDTKDGNKGVDRAARKAKSRSVTPRRLRMRRVMSSLDESSSIVKQKIAEMRKDIDLIQQRNREIEEAEKAAVASKESKAKPSRRLSSKGKSSEESFSESTSLKDASPEGMSLEEALKGTKKGKGMKRMLQTPEDLEKLDIKLLTPEELDFEAVDVEVPLVPMLSYGLDRVLFNPGVYRLQDPRSHVYNFDPYLEKIMSVDEFDFSALSEYKTSSKDEELLALTQRMGTKFTGSTSSMSGVLQHFHFLLSNFRPLNHEMLSRKFPSPSDKFSKITEGPSAIFLRWKDGIYAIDADKAYDKPNIMSWLGHSLEKLLTVERQEFERYRRSSTDETPGEDQSARCYHYSKLGNFLMRSQLDAHDPRLPGSGVFDLKTRAVVSIRMNHEEYESGKGYQLRYDHGEWESFEREFYDMTRATMLKYSLQVRMGRMDGIFVAYHNIERIFGFQYLSLPDMDHVLHGQKDTCLGDQEFKLSISLLDELIQKAIEKFPETVRALMAHNLTLLLRSDAQQTLHLHFHSHKSARGNPPFMYIFAEPVTEERADEIQNQNQEAHKAFARDIVGIGKDDPEIQKEWHEIQDRVDEEVSGQDKEVAEEEDGQAHEGEGIDQDLPAESSEAPSEEVEEASTEGARTADIPPTPTGPLMGWTLAVRHRVNGSYVNRPESIESGDAWTIEYHIRELNEEDRWALYEKVKSKRNDLIGEERDREDRKARMEKYREVIKRFSVRGRKWRDEQDALAAQVEQQVYQPLGPGSQVQAESTS
ncbi:hypothetical protein N0V90_001973 [Kalmusia sp. IMI 367209]|nr:hypothetical protein N0V90_001973 [Kalmusia sp. IMI 367209]